MRIQKFVSLLAIAAFAITSCKKQDYLPATLPVTSLNVVNAVVDTLNFYVNGTRINTASSVYPLGASGYLEVTSGEQNYQFKKPRSGVVLFNLPLTLDAANNYSLYIAGTSADAAFFTRDTLTTDTAGRARLRFVNASPDAGKVDVTVNDTLRFSARDYKTVSGFIPIGAGPKQIKIYQSGMLVAKVNERRPLSGSRVYTLFVRGKIDGSGADALSTGLVVNR